MLACTGPAPRDWPSPEPGQVEVLLVGTYHMSAPGANQNGIESEDVLTPRRQAELRELCDRLVTWAPDTVAVELPHTEEAETNRLFAEYVENRLAFDASRSFPETPITESRHEAVQIGFRLAGALELDRVRAVDEYPPKPSDDPFADRELTTTGEPTVDLPPPEHRAPKLDAPPSEIDLLAYHHWLNQEPQLAYPHSVMFDVGLRATDHPLGSPIILAWWYDRNLRIAHHLWRCVHPGTERICLVIGSGHIRILRHLLNETPLFCPVSPVELLAPE